MKQFGFLDIEVSLARLATYMTHYLRLWIMRSFDQILTGFWAIQTAIRVHGRLCFLGLGRADRVLDVPMIGLLRVEMAKNRGIVSLFEGSDVSSQEKAYILMSGHVAGASLADVQRHRCIIAKKVDFKRGMILEYQRKSPARLAHRDRRALRQSRRVTGSCPIKALSRKANMRVNSTKERI